MSSANRSSDGVYSGQVGKERWEYESVYKVVCTAHNTKEDFEEFSFRSKDVLQVDAGRDVVFLGIMYSLGVSWFGIRNLCEYIEV